MVHQATTTIMAIRHGETRWNVEERFQGHEDSPLTATGRRQVAALGRRLQEMPFDALISSDLGRAQETAAIIADFTGHAVETDARLRERHYGVLEGLSVPEIKAAHANVLAKFNADDPDYVIPGGESHRMHFERNRDWIEEILRTKTGSTIAIVIHGGVLDSLFRYVAHLPLAQPRCYVTSNASLSVFAHGQFYGTSRWVVQIWGDTGHLVGIGHHPGLG
ncbi:MAG: histidine phosphatase family protein [Desulfobacterales bacterium]|jgi:probable phosphoglycerate mutase